MKSWKNTVHIMTNITHYHHAYFVLLGLHDFLRDIPCTYMLCLTFSPAFSQASYKLYATSNVNQKLYITISVDGLFFWSPGLLLLMSLTVDSIIWHCHCRCNADVNKALCRLLLTAFAVHIHCTNRCTEISLFPYRYHTLIDIYI